MRDAKSYGGAVKMCDYCKDIPLVERIQSPKHYEQIVESIFELVDKKGFLVVEGTCPLGCHQVNQMWVDDIIYHIVKCPRCNQEFTCVVNTYRGGGYFKKGS